MALDEVAGALEGAPRRRAAAARRLARLGEGLGEEQDAARQGLGCVAAEGSAALRLEGGTTGEARAVAPGSQAHDPFVASAARAASVVRLAAELDRYVGAAVAGEGPEEDPGDIAAVGLPLGAEARAVRAALRAGRGVTLGGIPLPLVGVLVRWLEAGARLRWELGCESEAACAPGSSSVEQEGRRAWWLMRRGMLGKGGS